MTALYVARFLELKTMRHQLSLEKSAKAKHSTYRRVILSYDQTFVKLAIPYPGAAGESSNQTFFRLCVRRHQYT